MKFPYCEGTAPIDAHQIIHDALMDSQYLAGITAGWNAAQCTDPEAALAEVRKSREGHLSGFKDAKAAILSPVTNEGAGR